MRAFDEPQAAILNGGILQRDPEADDRIRFRVQIIGILVGFHWWNDSTKNHLVKYNQ